MEASPPQNLPCSFVRQLEPHCFWSQTFLSHYAGNHLVHCCWDFLLFHTLSSQSCTNLNVFSSSEFTPQIHRKLKWFFFIFMLFLRLSFLGNQAPTPSIQSQFAKSWTQTGFPQSLAFSFYNNVVEAAGPNPPQNNMDMGCQKWGNTVSIWVFYPESPD